MSDDALALRRRRRWGKVGRYTLLTVLSVIVLFPIYITVVNSLLPPVDITRQPPKLFPTNPQWGSYQDAWNAGHMGTYLKNSFIVTFAITVGQVLTAILAGYAFAFLQFPFKRVLFVVFLATLMVPFEVTIVTNVATISDLGWYNTYVGLAVPFLATGVAFARAMSAFRRLRDHYGAIQFVSGAVLVAIGLLLFFDRFWWLRVALNRALGVVGVGD